MLDRARERSDASVHRELRVLLERRPRAATRTPTSWRSTLGSGGRGEPSDRSEGTQMNERNRNIASRGATMAVDWEQRIDFSRLRTYRLARAKAMLEASDLGALSPVRPEQHPLRHEHAHRRVGARQERPLGAAAARRGADPVGLRLGRAASQALCAVAAAGELPRRRRADARGDAARDRRAGPAGRDDCATSCGSAVCRGAGRRRHGRPGDARGAPARRAPRRGRLARDARGAEDQDADEVALLDHACGIVDAVYEEIYRMLRPGVHEHEIVARPSSSCSSWAPSTSRRSTPSRATAATRIRTSSPTGCSGRATRRSST